MSLKTRTITGLTFGAVMIGGCIFHPLSCTLLFLLITVLCLWEFGGHVLTKDGTVVVNWIRTISFIFIGSCFPLLAALKYHGGYDEAIRLLYLFPAIAFSLFLFELFGKSLRPFHNLAYTALGVLYIGLPFSLLIWICSSPISQLGGVGNQFILAILFMVWASDVFAYLLGSKIGKNKMFPRISPNKTWEGTFSGVAGAILTGYLCSLVFVPLNLPMPFWIGLACICTFFGILGDLVESMFKRSLGIKDSGNLLPGHGGFLDRFDAFIFVIPFAYTYLIIYFNVW
ncbi:MULTISPECIES: phosphatidate cytidylyltransferase [unclassified Aureispira]|uniref:phosphatidate cytidylyltransferase n=1 Tax=unclassified Aureispira TaxID=2649989 RepID=UPI00069733A3|nr:MULTISPECIES: phosphatidate cytidylyltransferase [unclassified Aureispira]WMX15019.1 phosphatidate cytidylyltransferase [Aureispira sp. CCB-E]